MLTRLKGSVVRLFDFDATRLSLELEFVSGGSLDRHRDEHQMCTLDDSVLHRVWTEMGEALTYIHGRGVIHGDVKPQKILLKTDDTGAVLCDFGNASVNLVREYSG